ncbi:hypothetical protein L6164_026149 [Bauhinia variegata]|uniref:Uncharacterized protein n=1 Tax=Bauhinia variegata TaxID=167791 RepID=A0ACB9LPT9_BAUVA|nr:hypothetical protein L6164_026149 [Bauhinia variegata]
MVKIVIVVEKGLQLLEEMQRRNEAVDHSVEQRELTVGSAPGIIIKQRGQIQGHFNGAVIENLNLKTSESALFLNLPFFHPSWTLNPVQALLNSHIMLITGPGGDSAAAKEHDLQKVQADEATHLVS